MPINLYNNFSNVNTKAPHGQHFDRHWTAITPHGWTAIGPPLNRHWTATRPPWQDRHSTAMAGLPFDRHGKTAVGPPWQDRRSTVVGIIVSMPSSSQYL